MKEDKEFKKLKKALKLIPEFKDIEILKTWTEDVLGLEEEIKEKQKHLRVVKRERKLQPTLNVVTILGQKETKMVAGYKIGLNTNGNPFYCKDW